MGLLDDAIREHLELKRRHGADPSEVARQEHEALGPARREPQPPVAAEPEDVALEEELDEELVPELEAEAEPEPEPGPEATGPQGIAAGPMDPDPIDEPTMEHPAAQPEPDGRRDDGDDVLEGTPEFLEETPEHDRLWFEQRPPRDFDFDG